MRSAGKEWCSMEEEQQKFEKGYKAPRESVVETIKSVRSSDINGYGRLFGGRLMEWIDETAGLAAVMHCR